MKHTLLLICGFLVASASMPGQSKADQDKPASQAQIVSAAEIIKVDAKKKTLQVREVAPASTTRPRQRGGSGGAGRGGGGSRGGGRRGGGGGGGGGFPRGGGNGGGPGTATQAKEYKVFVTKDTLLKFAGVDIDFSSLHTGDRIAVSGTPKGSKGDLTATTITRQ
jgi:hypothetical protein